MLESLQSFDLKYAHVCKDMQLYVVVCLVLWSGHNHWKLGCFTSVRDGKSWPQALRPYRICTAALQNDSFKMGRSKQMTWKMLENIVLANYGWAVSSNLP